MTSNISGSGSVPTPNTASASETSKNTPIEKIKGKATEVFGEIKKRLLSLTDKSYSSRSVTLPENKGETFPVMAEDKDIILHYNASFASTGRNP